MAGRAYRALATLGVRTSDAAVARRQGLVNVAATVAVLSSAFHATEQSLMGLSDLWPLALHNAVFAVVFAVTPLLHRFGTYAAAGWLIATILLGTLNVVWLIGLDGGAQVYFTAVAASFLFFGLPGWRWYALSVLATVSATSLAYTFAPTFGPVGVLRPDYAQHLDHTIVFAAIAVNTWLFTIALIDTWRAEDRAALEAHRSDLLLQSILPGPVAARLKTAPRERVAEDHPAATILFADIAGFTSTARGARPDDLVAWLDSWVRTVDSLADAHGVEKIKTIGDAYMAAAGLHDAPRTGAARMARFALATQHAAANHRPLTPSAPPLILRMGIHTGPVVAGVIGGSRFAYDVWGDAVNIAARLEFSGVPGGIHVSGEFANMLRPDGFTLESRGETEIRDVGLKTTYWLQAAP